MAATGMSEEEMINEAIRQSLESAAAPKRKISVVEILDSDDEVDAVSIVVPTKKAAKVEESSKPATFLIDRAVLEKERLARQQKLAGGSSSQPTANPEGPSFSGTRAASSQPVNGFDTVPMPLTPAGQKGQGRFWNPEIYFTHVKGFPSSSSTVTLTEILDSRNLQRAFVSSYDWDVEYLFAALGGRQIPLWMGMPQTENGMLAKSGVHQHPGRAATQIIVPRMGGPFGVFHSKLMVLDFGTFVRVVIPSTNMGARDWEYVENTVFAQDFPRLTGPWPTGTVKANGSDTWNTSFGEALLDYTEAMGAPTPLLEWMKKFDYATEAQFIGSKPVSSSSLRQEQQAKYGLNRLYHAARQLGFEGRDIKVEFATSSLGALKPAWVADFGRAIAGLPLQSAAAAKAKATANDATVEVNFIFPSRRTIHESANGVHSHGSATLCWERKHWDAEPALRPMLRDYISKRTGLLSHSKYGIVEDVADGPNEIGRVYALRYCGSHNFTNAAWGRRTKDGLRDAKNWETGVLLPSRIAPGTRTLSGGSVPVRAAISRPYQTPLEKYRQSDVPFFRYEELNLNRGH
jgi:hypothetical protein